MIIFFVPHNLYLILYGPLTGSFHTPKWMHHTGVDRRESNITISNESSGCNKVLKSTTTGAETNSASVFSSSFFKHFCQTSITINHSKFTCHMLQTCRERWTQTFHVWSAGHTLITLQLIWRLCICIGHISRVARMADIVEVHWRIGQ